MSPGKPGDEAVLQDIRYAASSQSTELSLAGRQLTALPAEIGQLTNLQILSLSGNQLTALPAEIGQLTNLQILSLSGNQLTALPAQIGQLTNLQILSLSGNQLTALPAQIGQLTNLQSLDLIGNQLTALPAQIGQLTNLQSLSLSGNQLTALPAEIGQLTNLQHLHLDGNQLTALPAEIGQLTNLQILYLRGNQLTDLPPELGDLPETVSLLLGGNPLREPLPQFVKRGTRELFAYLRSLARAQPQYEAKVLLVGEGNVGKTSLVAALQGAPFVENRPTTHGIKLGVLPVRHPVRDVDLTLNTWDFGGQEVYRITHQFFFSRRALYLLVWRPREGQEENAIEAWCQRIRLRIGGDARIMIVATHCDERNPELDYPGLKRKFGDLLVGHYAVDNSSGKGIEALRRAIATQAARLPQMGELISAAWIAVRDELAALAQPQIAFREFVAVCDRHGLDGEETHALASLLHDLGHIIYYGDDDGLRDVVVLQPEWLTKAIGYVLEDTVTLQAGGVLAHARLSDLWEHRPDSESYPAACHPYFLRLMEKFDVSYRLPEEEQASLVGQLVPYERPTLPWDDGHESRGTRTLSLVCHASESPPGLVAWLTVRNHRFSTRPLGLHWRRGVFLAYPAYASEALFELADDTHLALTVRAPSPDYFFSVLRDSVEDLIARRWPGLAYELLVPCLTILGNGARCPGQFKFRSLQTFREQAKPTIDCHECAQPQDVARLLTGFSLPALPLQPQLEEVRERVEEMAGAMQRVEGYAADIANEIRAVLRVVSAEVADCPALFTLAPSSTQGMRRLWQARYRLTLWCAHPGAWHPWPQAAYDLSRPKDWLASIAPYAVLVSKTLRLVVPIAGAVAGVVWSDEQLKGIEDEIELMTTVVDKLPEHSDARLPVLDSGHRLTQAEGAGLRSLRTLLLEQDPSRSFGGLRRVRTPSGDFLWICADHYPEYDPGLPQLPQ